MNKFSKRQYIMIAQAISRLEEKDEVISEMADMFAWDNDKFDRAKFEAACRATKGEPYEY